jgi:hypothetical protein
MQMQKLKKRVILCVLMVMSVSGCAIFSQGGEFCDIYEPVYMSGFERDTVSDETQNQVDANNVVWLELCQ